MFRKGCCLPAWGRVGAGRGGQFQGHRAAAGPRRRTSRLRPIDQTPAMQPTATADSRGNLRGQGRSGKGGCGPGGAERRGLGPRVQLTRPQEDAACGGCRRRAPSCLSAAGREPGGCLGLFGGKSRLGCLVAGAPDTQPAALSCATLPRPCSSTCKRFEASWWPPHFTNIWRGNGCKLGAAPATVGMCPAAPPAAALPRPCTRR